MKFHFLSLYLILIFAILGAFSPIRSSASSPESVSVNMTPDNPGPDQNVIITLNSYINDLDSVFIMWSVDGKTVLSGVGKKTFSVNTPSAGSETRVTASVSLPDGNIEKNIVLRPSVMELLWQANDSYVPPFYKGKALPTSNSEIKVVAMPEIRTGTTMINPNNMTYAWKQDYSNDQEASGYGKNYFLYTGDYLDDTNNISVTASSTDQQYSSTANINIGTVKPEILFYKKDPKLGTIWEQALNNGHKVGEAEIIVAEPFFISPEKILTPILNWDWSINGNPITLSGLQKNLLPLKVQAGISGTSQIRLEVTNNYKIFETVTKELNVQF